MVQFLLCFPWLAFLAIFGVMYMKSMIAGTDTGMTWLLAAIPGEDTGVRNQDLP